MKMRSRKPSTGEEVKTRSMTKLTWPRCTGPLFELLNGGSPDPSSVLLPIFSKPDLDAAILPLFVAYLLWSPADATDILASDRHRARLEKITTLHDGLNLFSEVLQPDEIGQLLSKVTRLRTPSSASTHEQSPALRDNLSIRCQPQEF